MLHLFFKSKSPRESYYHLLNLCMNTMFDEQQMWHYPLYEQGADKSLLESQANLTDYCMNHIPELRNKRILEIGCGNGTQSIYIYKNYMPMQIHGVDINPANIALAIKQKEKQGISNIEFTVDNSQQLFTVADNSKDIVICIESAFHYPDKAAFLEQVNRVLVPGGYFLIADILSRSETPEWRKKQEDDADIDVEWTYQEYANKFAELNFKLHTDKDISKSIIAGLAHSKKWFSPIQGKENKKSLRYRLCKSYLLYIAFRYRYKLKHSSQYRLFVGTTKA